MSSSSTSSRKEKRKGKEESKKEKKVKPSKKDEEEYEPNSSSPESESTKKIYVDPTYDTTFKKICSQKPVVISLLNTFLQLSQGKQIVDIDFISQEDQPEILGLKSLRFDVICRDKNDNTFVVEMQRHHEPAFIQRTVHYCAKVYSSGLRKGEKYSSLTPVVLLVFLNFRMFDRKNKYISHYVLKDKIDNDTLTNDFQITYVEIDKFNKTDIQTIEDEWMYLFKDYKTKGELENASDEVATAMKLLQSMSKEEMEAYDEEVKQAIDFEGILKTEKEASKQEGLKEGEERGRQAIVLRMIQQGLGTSQITDITGLTKTQLEQFSQNLNK